MWNFKLKNNQLAIVESNGRTWTYQALQDEILLFHERIRDSRSLIFILTQNNIESLVAYTFAMEYDHVALLLNAEMNQSLLLELIRIYQPNYLWLPESFDCNVDGYNETVISGYRYKLLQQQTLIQHRYHPDLALLLTTSGSTGNPKLIRLSKSNVASNMEAIASYLKLTASDRAITTLPMNYTYGLSIINSHLVAGASIVLTDDSIVDANFWSLYEQYQPTSLNGVPYTYQLLRRLIKPHHFNSLRYMTQAGGRLGSQLQKHFAELTTKHNVDFFVMYGQTEATARMAYLDPSFVTEKLDSIGQPIPGGRFELVDEHGDGITTPNTLGELIYHGPNVSMGYATSLEDLSNDDEFQGRLSTGDLAIVDDDGFFFIQGRLNRYVKVYGVRINLDDIEKELIKMADGIELVVAGEEDQINVFSTGTIDSKLIGEAASKFRLHPTVFRSHVIDEIPKNQAGKVLYSRLNERIQR